MPEKIKYGMSTFWKDVLWGLFFLVIVLVPWVYQPFIDLISFKSGLWMLRIVITLFFIGLKILLIFENIGEYCGVSFRIIEEDGIIYPRYKVQVFRPRFLFIVWGWAPMSKNYHSYEGENIFGAKTYSGYSTEKTYESELKAREAIREYKDKAKRKFTKYFAKKEIKIQKIIKA